MPIAASRTVKLGGTVATMGFPDIGLPDFLNHETHELHENKKQIHSVSAFVCLVYFVVKIFSHAFGQGEITSLAGAADDPRYFQISLPVQPGSWQTATVRAGRWWTRAGTWWASWRPSWMRRRRWRPPGRCRSPCGRPPSKLRGKSSLLLSFLESVPDVAAKFKETNRKDEAFEDVVKSAQDAAVLVLVY